MHRVRVSLASCGRSNHYLAAVKQLYEWFSPSVCLSFHPSVLLSRLFNRGQIWPSGTAVACICLCVGPSVHVCSNHKFVHTTTCHLFKLESPNLDQKCRTTWLRSLLFWGLLTVTLQCQIKLKIEIFPILSLSTR